MIDFKRRLKNFGPLEILVISSIIYVVCMLTWTASTRSTVIQNANDIKSNHKLVVDFLNNEINVAVFSRIQLNVAEYIVGTPLLPQKSCLRLFERQEQC